MKQNVKDKRVDKITLGTIQDSQRMRDIRDVWILWDTHYHIQETPHSGSNSGADIAEPNLLQHHTNLVFVCVLLYYVLCIWLHPVLCCHPFIVDLVFVPISLMF